MYSTIATRKHTVTLASTVQARSMITATRGTSQPIAIFAQSKTPASITLATTRRPIARTVAAAKVAAVGLQ